MLEAQQDTQKVITIITATFNADACIENLIKSVLCQLTDKVEFIIIDGNSKDNTISIIKRYEEYIAYWSSESDNGIYDAWNKGIRKAKGEWIMFLGADDLLQPNALETYFSYLEHEGNVFDIITSRLDYVNENGSHIKFVGEPWNWNKFKMSRMSFAHPGLLHNAKLFITNGLFDSEFKICGDSEFFLRTHGDIVAGFLDFVTVKMQRGGMSLSVKAIIESYKIRKKNHFLSTSKNCLRFLFVFVKYNVSISRHFINTYFKR